MSRVRSSGNATTELRLVALLRSAGITGWRRHYPLPGKPDFTFPARRVVVFVDGCFWHGHKCGRKLRPNTNIEAWQAKIEATRRRDRRATRELRTEGWSVVRIWECVLTKRPNQCLNRLRRALELPM